MKRTHRVKSVPQEVIQEMLGGGLTIRCSLCGGAARIPEDVVAVQGNECFVVCEGCTPRFEQEIKDLLERMREEPS